MAGFVNKDISSLLTKMRFFFCKIFLILEVLSLACVFVENVTVKLLWKVASRFLIVS